MPLQHKTLADRPTHKRIHRQIISTEIHTLLQFSPRQMTGIIAGMNQPTANNKLALGITLGVALGIVLGVRIGLATHNLALWLAVGTGAGMAFGAALGAALNRSQQ